MWYVSNDYENGYIDIKSTSGDVRLEVSVEQAERMQPRVLGVGNGKVYAVYTGVFERLLFLRVGAFVRINNSEIAVYTGVEGNRFYFRTKLRQRLTVLASDTSFTYQILDGEDEAVLEFIKSIDEGIRV